MTASATAAMTTASQKLFERLDDLQPDVGAENEQSAVREVEDPHDAEGQREAGGQQKEDERVRKTVKPRDQAPGSCTPSPAPPGERPSRPRPD